MEFFDSHRAKLLLALTGFLSLLNGCASDVLGNRMKIQLGHDATITSQGQEPQPIKQGEAFNAPLEPVFVEAPGKVGLLILPNVEGGESVTVNLRSIRDWGGAGYERRAAEVLNQVIGKIIKVQTLASSKRAQEALQIVDQLMEEYPGLSYLKFLRASCLVVMGRNDAAEITLKEALAEFPDDQDGKLFLKTLTR